MRRHLAQVRRLGNNFHLFHPESVTLVATTLSRFDIALGDIEKWTNNLLPSRQFGKVSLTEARFLPNLSWRPLGADSQ